ncbi:MAG: PQQ-like beta-propeller repeat protein [Planctomycetes bacterium]|nr:PQQ-like beta-propeller repeat protein [Planctomycetota bacterium]
MNFRFPLAIILSLFVVNSATAEDWPQFHGPRRDNRSAETGLLKQWPTGGPELVWKAGGIGQGFATVAIIDGMIYTTGNIDKDTVITAMDMSGREIWKRKNGPAYTRSHPGSRSTPTIADGKLYNMNGDGDLICMHARTGATIWTVNMLDKFQGRMIQWGISESPLIDGDNVICCPGGQEVSMAALDRDTGETRWTCRGAGDKPGYTSAMIVDYQGLRQIVTLMYDSAIGVAAETGKLLWQYPHKVRFGVNCDMPIYHDGHVFLFGTWGRGATKLKLNVEGDDCSVEEVWRTAELDNEHGGVMIVDGYLYGQADGDHKRRHMACLELKTGKTMWTARELSGERSASLTFAEGMLYLVSDRGEIGLVRPNPNKFEIVSQFELPKKDQGVFYAHPVVYGKRLYIRHGEFLYAYDIDAKAAATRK